MIGLVAPQDSDDRRGDPRQPIELKVEYKRLNAFFADYTKNISRGGTFIQTGKPLPVGTEFVFKLYVPTLEQALHIRGEVKWIVEPRPDVKDLGTEADGSPRVPGMGIRFVYTTDDERRHIEHLVERLMVDSLGQLVYSKLMTQGDRGDKDKPDGD
ncbi:MAG TPA: TIGR02266 family protein [Kofleriaceae bacterium]|jgi:type IV pilus assembly protein PilZ